MNILEELWYNYIIEDTSKRSNQENAIINQFKEVKKSFRSTLSKEQEFNFEEYDNALSKVGRMSEKMLLSKELSLQQNF